MAIQNTEYVEKMASLLTLPNQDVVETEQVKEASADPYKSTIKSSLTMLKPLAGAYLGYKGVKTFKNMNTKQRVGAAAATLVLADLLANPNTGKYISNAVHTIGQIPRRRRRITRGDLAVAAGLGAAGIVTVNKLRGLHRRATYGAEQPTYNTTPVYYSQTSY